MAKITHISLENFRVFQDKNDFDIQPITILTGPNSSGKSSLFKALLLLKYNSSVNSLWKLDFSGNRHKLGTFTSTRNQYTLDDDLIYFSIDFELKVNKDRRGRSTIYKYPVSTIKGVKMVPYETSQGEVEYIGIKMGYKRDGDNGKLVDLTLFYPHDDSEYFKIKIGSNPNEDHFFYWDIGACRESAFLESTILRNYTLKDLTKFLDEGEVFEMSISPYLSSIKNEKKVFTDDFAQVLNTLDKELQRRKRLSEDSISRRNTYFIQDFLNQTLTPLLSILGHFEYVEAFRANTRRIYTNDSQGTSFNELLVEFNATNVTEKGQAFINKWLGEFKIADRIVFQKVEGVANVIYLEKGKNKTLLADLGFGITQFLPILMKIALETPISERRFPRDKPIKKLILLEEPETNLHPKLQSLVADMLVDACKNFEVQFIVETHSEYLIRKLQYLIAKKEWKNGESLVYYIHDLAEMKENDKQVSRIRINEDGSFDSEFGKGFFDEANNLIGKIWEAR